MRRKYGSDASCDYEAETVTSCDNERHGMVFLSKEIDDDKMRG